MVVGAAIGLVLPSMQVALADAPSNDRVGTPIEIGSLPFIGHENTSDATASGPKACGNSSSVFYRFTPAEDATLQADTFGSNYDTVVTVFTGTHGAFETVGCNDDALFRQSAVGFRATAGTTYYFMIATCVFVGGECLSGRDDVGGHLEFALTERSTAAPEVSVAVESATLHPGALVRIEGTATCNGRFGLDVFGRLRQLRDDEFVASGFFEVSRAYACNPGAVASWTAWADTQTGAAFVEGGASARTFVFALNAFDSANAGGDRAHVRIVRG